MHGDASVQIVSAYLVLIGVGLVTLRPRSKTSFRFSWRGRRGLLEVTVTSREFRVYRSRWPEPLQEDDPNLGFSARRWGFGPMFSNARAAMDTAYFTWGGFMFARGVNTETHTRYRVLSVPYWLPLLMAVGALMPSAVGALVALI